MGYVINSIEYEHWLREQARLKRPYWYGTYFNPCTEALLQRKKKQYPSHYTEKRMATYRKHIADKQIAGDCVNGAIKGAIWSELGTRQPEYASHGCPDKSADGMFVYCKGLGVAWGPIDTMPDKPCVAVRFSGHVGIYVGNGEVVEWKGFNYGCVITKLKKGKWTHWYELPWVKHAETTGKPVEEISGIPDTGALGNGLLKLGSKGEDVRTLQQMLMLLGYDLHKYEDDGVFGEETETALKKFQRQHGLEVDGKYGDKSHAELMGCVADLAEEEEDEPVNGKHLRVIVTGGSVFVRMGAGTKYDVVTVVRAGDMYKHIATADNGWYAIDLGDGRNGWISPKYTKLEE